MGKIQLSSTQSEALRQIKTKVMAGFPVVDVVLVPLRGERGMTNQTWIL